MQRFASGVLAALLAAIPAASQSQTPTRALVAVLAHPDDETPAGPLFARYAREGVKVYLLIATDGGQSQARGDTTVRKQDLPPTRSEEARCAAQAMGLEPPILLSFPDGKLGDYISDRTLLTRLTQRIAEELERLRPDAIVTWGPDGGTGHPDHRIISDIVTQLQHADAPGVPERIFYMYMPAEGMRAANPQRGVSPLLVPNPRLATARVSFRPEDFEAWGRSMACHRSQFTPELIQRFQAASASAWNGTIPLIPAFSTAPITDVFAGQPRR